MCKRILGTREKKVGIGTGNIFKTSEGLQRPSVGYGISMMNHLQVFHLSIFTSD